MLCEDAAPGPPWDLGEKKRSSLVLLEVQSRQVSNLLEREISQGIWSGLPCRHHGPRGLSTMCWAAATPAGCKRGTPGGAEGEQPCLCILRMWPMLQTSESLLYVFFFQGTRSAPRTDPTKYHVKALLELLFFSASVR